MWGYPYWAACVGRGEFFLSRWWLFSLTERTEFTEHFCAQFRAHRRPPAYRVHRALLPKVAVRFCEIGWLNVSVECCVFCSSVLFCERKYAPSRWDKNHESCWGVFSLTQGVFFSHRAHRVHWALLRTVSSPQKASGIQSSQSVTAKGGCKVLWNRLT